MTPHNALDYICEEAKRNGATQYDALAGQSESIGVDLFESKVKNTEITVNRGIGIRLFIGNKPGYAYTERFSKDSISQTVRDAVNHAKISDPMEVDLPSDAILPDIDLQTWNADLQDVDIVQMKELGLEMEAISKNAHPLVENIPYLGVGRTSGFSIIQNSNGVRFEVKGNAISAGIGVVACQGESKKMGVYSNSERDFKKLDPTYMSNTAVERAVELLGARPVSGGPMPVVLSNRISPQIFSMYGSSFCAETVQKGQSKLEGKVGQQIADSALHLVCDPHIPGAPGSRLFDGEGVVCQPKGIIENGVLCGYLYNLESANKEKKQSTGHASRDYSGQVGTGFSNFLVAKGEKSLDDLLTAYPKCLYVTSLEGASGCSSVSGEISIGIQGFLYEQGQRVQPVEGVTMSSNFFDMIRQIKGLSCDYTETRSSVKVPDTLVETMFLAG